jgi:hypothetical protein
MLPASFCAFRRDAGRARETTSITRYPAFRNDNASALPRLPAPTIAMLGFFARLCGIGAE